LQGDGSELGGGTGILVFRQKDEESLVNTGKIKSSKKEIREHTKDVRGDAVPEGREETGAKAIGARTGAFVHTREGANNLFFTKRGREREPGREERVGYNEFR
jgi:hypothetical protein